jgi:hypothetical protein
MHANRSNNNLIEELEGREFMVAQLERNGGLAGHKNFHKNQIRAIRKELARRWRNQANEKMRARTAKKAAGKWLHTLYKPATSTSPAGMRAAAAISAHMSPMSYANVAARQRAMLRARRARNNRKKSLNR